MNTRSQQVPAAHCSTPLQPRAALTVSFLWIPDIICLSGLGTSWAGVSHPSENLSAAVSSAESRSGQAYLSHLGLLWPPPPAALINHRGGSLSAPGQGFWRAQGMETGRGAENLPGWESLARAQCSQPAAHMTSYPRPNKRPLHPKTTIFC